MRTRFGLIEGYEEALERRLYYCTELSNQIEDLPVRIFTYDTFEQEN